MDAYWACFASAYTSVKKIVLSVHGLNLDFRFLSNKMGGFSKVEKSILGKIDLKYVSGVARDFYAGKYGWKELEGEVIYNGIDWSKFVDAQKCSAEDEPWLREGRPVFLMAGSFNPRSRLQGLVCRVLAALRKEKPLPFKFVFAGAKNPKYPHLYDDCISFCEENGMLDKDVFFLGGRRDIPSIMASVQGYVYASESDTFGLSVVEAAGCGLPVLCSDIPALREVLHNGKFGKLVPNDEEIFAKEIVSLYAEFYPDRISPYKSGADANGAAIHGFGVTERNLNALALQIRDIYSIRNCFEGYYCTNP